MEPTTFFGFLFALALGGLIGTERELPWGGTKIGGAIGFGGIRSYASIALLGAIAVWLDHHTTNQFWTLLGAIISALLIITSYVYSSFHSERMGVTSEYAAFITYMIGVIAMNGYYSIAVILAILLLLILSTKEFFTKLKTRFSREELGDSLKFAVIALVILPLLPDAKYSFLDMANWFHQGGLVWTHPILNIHFFNPYGVWFFVVVMTGVEYIGFILSKMMGEKGGIIASGAIGGLISSTATTLAMTRKSREHPEHMNSYVVATLLSSCIMFIRVIVVAGYLYASILDSLWIPALMMLLGLSGAAFYYSRQRKKEKTPIQAEERKESYESPFQILPALQFSGLIILIKFISGLGKVYQDIIPLKVSSYFIGLFSGLADVDGVNYIYSTAAKAGEVSLIIASTTILIAVISNNTVKSSIAYRFGEPSFGRRVLTGFSISTLLGIITIIVLNM